jgi:prophage regulatory protein
MATNDYLRILRKPQAMEALGLPLSSFNLRVKQRLITSPISLGARAVGWPSSEIDSLVLAICSGATKNQIEALVIDLEHKRRTGMSVQFSAGIVK